MGKLTLPRPLPHTTTAQLSGMAGIEDTPGAAATTLLAKYQEAVQWLCSAARESVKTSNVDLHTLIRDCTEATACVREILSVESHPLRISALEQLLVTLTHQQAVLVAKQRQLESATLDSCSGATRGGQLSSCVDNSEEQRRRLRAIEETILPAKRRREEEGRRGFASVAGLELAKQALREAIVLPVQFPHLFTGARRPWSRVLLYGPPGTGKSRLAQAVSGEADSAFYCVSSSHIVSSWLGESEKIIRDLFQHARKSPGKAVVFFDEIDSVCRVRSSREEEHTRRIKTELLKQMEGGGVAEGAESNVFLLCATNCPWELDPAFLRRFQRRIYVSLPNRKARREIFESHFSPSFSSSSSSSSSSECVLTEAEWEELLACSEGYSGSDIATCVADALLEPVREMETAGHWRRLEEEEEAGGWGMVPCSPSEPGAVEQSLADLSPLQVRLRPVSCVDLLRALQRNGATVSAEEVEKYEQFTVKLGQSAH